MNTATTARPYAFATVGLIGLAAIAASLGLASYGHEVTAPASEIVQLERVEILGRHMPDGQVVSVTRLPTVVITGRSTGGADSQLAGANSARDPRI
jgi:hypothetical protein